MISRAMEDACYSAIMHARLEKPIVYQAFTQYFSTEKLEKVRDTFGYELYRRCLQDAVEVIEKYGG